MTTPIRVAMFIHRYYPFIGGAERQLQSLAPFLRNCGIEVYVFTRRDPSLQPFEKVDDVPVYRLPIPGPKPVAAAAYTLAAMQAVNRVRPHIVHAHGMTSPATTAITAKWLFRLPVVITAHRSAALGDVQRLQKKAGGNQRLALIRANTDRFVTISHEIQDELTGIGVQPERCVHVPNAVDAERFAPLAEEARQAMRVSLGFGQAPVALFAGRLAPEKGVDRLISVWPSIRAAYPGAEFVILGQGEEEARLKSLAGPGVRFEGAVDNVVPYLQAADVFVLPSAAEGLSVALLEALACGLPPIVTSVGGAVDVINHGDNGWLIPPDDNGALQDALLHLIGDASLRVQMAQRGRMTILENYTLPLAAERLRKLYLELAQPELKRGQQQ